MAAVLAESLTHLWIIQCHQAGVFMERRGSPSLPDCCLSPSGNKLLPCFVCVCMMIRYTLTFFSICFLSVHQPAHWDPTIPPEGPVPRSSSLLASQPCPRSTLAPRYLPALMPTHLSSCSSFVWPQPPVPKLPPM